MNLNRYIVLSGLLMCQTAFAVNTVNILTTVLATPENTQSEITPPQKIQDAKTLTTDTVQAEKKRGTLYSVSYSTSSPLKNVTLKQEALRIGIYANGTPQGIVNVKLDENQTFTLEKKYAFPVAIEVLSVSSQKRHGAHCSGNVVTGHTQIELTCEPHKK